MQIGLTENHGPRFAESLNDQRIILWNIVGEKGRPVGTRYPGDINAVFYRYRHTRQ